MDDEIFKQLFELVQALDRVGVQAIICGGLGMYLCFSDEGYETGQILRATKDVDVILAGQAVSDQTKREAIAGIILDELNYIVREDAKHFRFQKEHNQQLDILTPPVEGIQNDGVRAKLVKSRLHGRIMPEARFIEEDLRAVSLSSAWPDCPSDGLKVLVPSPTNLLMLKLFAFNDRIERDDRERALDHAWDIYAAVILANRKDYLQGQEFLARHDACEIVQKARSIVSAKFSSLKDAAWQYVLGASGLYPDFNVSDRRARLDAARRRLLRWF